MKRADLRAGAHEDLRQFKSSYHLSEDQVNVFQHDVKPRPRKAKVCPCIYCSDGYILIVLLLGI
jgi:hypothetical protein